MQTKEENRTIRVAICAGFARPFDLAGTLAKALALLEDAARSGAQLVCFGEPFFPAIRRGSITARERHCGTTTPSRKSSPKCG